MTSVSNQVLIDLDNDGWINEGVPIGAPVNIFPRAPYTTGSRLHGRQYTTLTNQFSDVQEISTQGLMKRSVKMGKDGSGDYAQDIQALFDGYYSIYQRRLTDPENLIPKSIDADYGGVYIPPSVVHSAVILSNSGRQGYQAGAANSCMTLGLDYSTSSIHGQYMGVGYLDGSNQYSRAPVTSVTADTTKTGSSNIGGNGASLIKFGQTFRVLPYSSITRVDFVLDTNSGSPTGSITVELYLGVGTPTSLLYSTTVTPTPNAVNAVLIPSGSAIYTGGANYLWVVLSSTQTAGNFYRVKCSSGSSSYADGEVYISVGGGAYTLQVFDAAISVFTSAITTTWGGFSVVAGQSYTLVMGVNISGTAVANTAKFRIYGDSSTLTSPNFGRVYLTGYDYVQSGSIATTLTFNFTVPVGTTQIAIDTQDPVTGVIITISGLMLLNGTVSTPTHFYDEQVVYGTNMFSTTIDASKAYTLSFWAKSADGIDGLVYTLGTAKIGYPTTVKESSGTLAITSSWQRFDFALANRAYERGIGLEATTTKGGVATGNLNVGTIEFRGFMLVEGTSPTTYQVGPLAAYDDITEYVMSVDTRSGKSNFLDSLAYEGTANILLNNVSKLFSPSNASSPLYGYLIQNLKIIIRMSGSSIWQGWVTEYTISPGLFEERQVTLVCSQGLYRLQDGSFSASIKTDVRIDTAIKQIVENSGWKSTGTPYFSMLNYNGVLDESLNLSDPTTAFSRIDTGINLIEITGLDWGSDTAVDKAIQDLLDSESAMLWIDRNGKLVMVNRDFWVNRTADETYNIDTTPYLTKAEYRYGQEVVNRVQVTLNRKKQTLAAPVWKTYRAIYVKSHGSFTVEVNPQYTEGRKRTVVKFSLDGVTKTVYSKDPGMKYLNTVAASSTDSDNVILELFPDVGNRYQLRLTNNSNIPLWIDVELKGDYLETADSTPMTYEDTKAIELTQAVHLDDITTTVLSRDYEAASLAEFRILRAAYPEGEFTSLEFTVATEELLNPLLATQIGHIIEITEGQTGEVSNPHAVIAEEFSVNGGVVTVRFLLAKAQKQRFFALDTNKLYNPTVNLIENMYNYAVIDGGGVASIIEWPYDGLSKAIKWNVGGAGIFSSILLNPAYNQYRKFDSHTLASVWPELTAASASTAPNCSIILQDNYTGFINSSFWDSSIAPGTSEPMAVLYGNLTGINWRLLYGAELRGISKQGDTVFNAIARITAKKSTPFRVYGRVPAALSYTTGATGYAIRVHSSWDTLATGIATSAGDANGSIALDFSTNSSTDMIAFSFYGSPSAANTSFPMGHLGLLQRGKLDFPKVVLDTSITHKYTLYAKTDPQYATNTFTLDVYGVDGTIIATQTQVVGYTETKFEVTIPTGSNSANPYAIFSDVVGTTQCNIYILAHGITDASVTSASDLIATQTQTTLYL